MSDPVPDIFLAHNSKDKGVVERIGRRLIERGFTPWLDKWSLPPGRPFQDELEKALETTKTIAAFVGASGIGPWERHEIRAALSQFIKRGLPVIPVVLPDCKGNPKLPTFLAEFSWVRFETEDDEEALDALEWGITGNNPASP